MTLRCTVIGGIADGRTIEVDSGYPYYTVPVHQKLPLARITEKETQVEYEPVQYENYRVEHLHADETEFWFLVPMKWDIATAMCKLVEGYRPLLPRKG